MNCKRDQLAFVVVPREYAGSGLEQLNNHVVKTLEPVFGYPVPTWRITPPQRVVFRRGAVDFSGKVILPGEYAETDMLPDSFLRPFDPDSEPKDESTTRDKELTA